MSTGTKAPPFKGRFRIRLGSKLALMREKRGLSQAAFARQCGMDRSHVCHIEKGTKEPSAYTLNTMLIGLGIGTLHEALCLLEARQQGEKNA